MSSEVERQHQARTLKVGRKLEPRLSRADEQQLTDDVRRREDDAKATADTDVDRSVDRVQQDIDSLRKTLRAHGRLDKRAYRNLDRARLAVGRLRPD